MLKISLVVFWLLFMTSSCKSYKLTRDDLKWNPYKGNEILVFQNDNGDIDTIFVISVERLKNPDDPLAVSPNYHESVEVMVKHSDPTPPNDHRYLQSPFLKLYSAKDKNTLINFALTAKNAWFYSGKYNKNELEKLATAELVTKNFKYDDVLRLVPKSMEYFERDEFITTVYWSKKDGYVRFDLKNGVYWELIKKYSLR